MYWSDELDEDKRVENNKDKVSILGSIYNTYYNQTFDANSLDIITYTGRISPWQVIFKIAYLTNDGGTDYLWEYFDNWVKILNANRY
jgi:hypothetical protein